MNENSESRTQEVKILNGKLLSVMGLKLPVSDVLAHVFVIH